MQQLITSIYRSKRREGMYLYVDKKAGLDAVPEALLKQFGVAEQAMTLLLTPDKKLANADVEKVLDAIAEQGFYLQMPPTASQEMSDISDKNSKMPR